MPSGILPHNPYLICNFQLRSRFPWRTMVNHNPIDMAMTDWVIELYFRSLVPPTTNVAAWSPSEEGKPEVESYLHYNGVEQRASPAAYYPLLLGDLTMGVFDFVAISRYSSLPHLLSNSLSPLHHRRCHQFTHFAWISSNRTHEWVKRMRREGKEGGTTKFHSLLISSRRTCEASPLITAQCREFINSEGISLPPNTTLSLHRCYLHICSWYRGAWVFVPPPISQLLFVLWRASGYDVGGG